MLCRTSIVHKNASIAENLGGLGYVETAPTDLNGCFNWFRPYLQKIMNVSFGKISASSSGKLTQSCQDPTPSRSVKRSSFIPSAEVTKCIILQAIDSIEDKGDKGAVITANNCILCNTFCKMAVKSATDAASGGANHWGKTLSQPPPLPAA